MGWYILCNCDKEMSCPYLVSRFKDKIWCDVIPIDVGHEILTWMSQFMVPRTRAPSILRVRISNLIFYPQGLLTRARKRRLQKKRAWASSAPEHLKGKLMKSPSCLLWSLKRFPRTHRRRQLKKSAVCLRNSKISSLKISWTLTTHVRYSTRCRFCSGRNSFKFASL